MTEREELLFKKYLKDATTEQARRRLEICVKCMYFNDIHKNKCPYCSCAWQSYINKPYKKCVKNYW
jgi:uncharacterized paraquat-inducible protein A